MNAIRKVLLAMVIFLTFSSTSAAAMPPSIFINGNLLYDQDPPIIENDRVLVPLRAIFEKLNRRVSWNLDDQSIISGDIWLQIGNPVAKVKDKQITLDVTAEIIDDRTYVPLRFIAESLGKKVTWDSINNKIDINDDIYRSKLKSTKQLIDTNSTLYQNIADEILSQWKSCLDRNYEGSGICIDKNITALEYKSIHDTLGKRDKDIIDSLNSLSNPEPDYFEAYNSLKAYFNSYSEMKNLATLPRGSFNSYSSSVNEVKGRLNLYKSKLGIEIF